MGIELRNKLGEFFELAPKTKVTHVRENPFFFLEFGFSSPYILPFGLPKSEQNIRLIGDVDNVQSQGVKKKIPVVMDVDGENFLVGQLNILEVESDNIRVSITRESVEFNVDKHIDTLDLIIETAVQSDVERTNNLTQNYPDTNFKYIQTFNKGVNYSHGLGVDVFEPESLTNHSNGASFNMNNSEYCVPYFNLIKVIEALCSKNDYTLTGDFKREILAQKTYIFNTTLVNTNIAHRLSMHGIRAGRYARLALFPQGSIYKPNPKKTSGTRQTNEDFYDPNFFFQLSIGTTVSFYANVIDVNGNITSSTTISRIITAPDIVSVSAFLTVMASLITTNVPGATLVSSSDDYYRPFRDFNIAGTSSIIVFTKSPTGKVYLHDGGQRDGISDDIFHNALPINASGGSFSYNIPNSNFHLPSISSNAFLSAVHFNFAALIDIDTVNGVVNIDFKRDVFKGPVLDISHAMGYSKPQSFTEEMPIILVWENDDTDNMVTYLRKHANNYPEHAYPNKRELRFDGGTLLKEDEYAFDPIINKSCRYDMVYGNYTEGKQDFALRFIKLQDFVDGSTGVVCTDDGLKPNQLYTEYWHEYYSFIKEGIRIWKRSANLSRSELLKIQPKTRLREDNQHYIWKSLSSSIHSEQGLLETAIEWVRI